MSLGFAPHRSINIIGFNSAEWFIANMGAIAAGGIAAGIYTSNLPEVHTYPHSIVLVGGLAIVWYRIAPSLHTCTCECSALTLRCDRGGAVCGLLIFRYIPFT